MLHKESYRIIFSFKTNSSRISLSQSSLSEGKNLDNKNFMKSLTNQNVCL